MSSEFPVLRMVRSRGAGIRSIVSCLFVVTMQVASPVFAEFNPAGWRLYRAVQVPATVPKGLVAIGLESSVIQECLPNMEDLRMAASDGSEVPLLIQRPTAGEEPAALRARVFRMAKRPGEWTDIRIDKTAKVLSCGIEVRTASKDFLRRVEIRGSDNDRDSYVIRLDGLIADMSAPGTLRSLDIRHALNNFRYIHVRILDKGRPSLDIGGVVCHHPTDRTRSTVPVNVRILKNKRGRAAGSRTMVADLGKMRFPMVSLAISSPAEQFITPVTIAGSHSPTAQTWERIYEGTFFRIRKGQAVKERLEAQFRPTTFRYVKLEMSGGTPAPLVVDDIRVNATMPLAIFHHSPGRNYRMYYGNPQASALPPYPGPVPADPAAILAGSSAIRLGRVQKNSSPRAERVAVTPQQHLSSTPSGLRSIAGAVLVLAGLLLLFNLMLRSRSRRKRSGY